MNKIFLFILLLFLFSFCSTFSDQNQNKKILKIDLKQSNPGKFSELFSSISYTFLDGGENNFLAMPGKLTAVKNMIFVKDSRLSNLLIFNKDGNLKTSIKANINPGPGEFLQSEDFQVLDDQIKVRDYPQNKTFIYDLDGRFLGEERDIDLFYYFHEAENWKLSYMGFSGGPASKLFLLENKFTGDTLYQFAFPNELDVMNYGSKNGFMADPSNNSLYFTIPHSYQTIQFNENGFLEQIIELDIKNGGISIQDRTQWSLDRTLNQKAKENQLAIRTDSFFPLGNFFFIHLRQSHPEIASNHFILLNKSFNKLYQSKNLLNDLDGMPLNGVPWSYTDNSIILLINSIQFYNDYTEKYSGETVLIMEGNIHDFFHKNKEKMMEEHYIMVTLNLKNDLEVGL